MHLMAVRFYLLGTSENGKTSFFDNLFIIRASYESYNVKGVQKGY